MKISRYVIGAILIALGVISLLNILGIISVGAWTVFWSGIAWIWSWFWKLLLPAILVVVGICMITNNFQFEVEFDNHAKKSAKKVKKAKVVKK